MLRATLKSMLSRKLRLLLSTVAVVLGVMFVSGALVLTDTLGRSFDNLFSNIYEYTDIEVSRPSDLPSLQGPVPLNIPEAEVARVEAVPGVADATGQVFVQGARALGADGRVVLSQAPRFGASWTGENELVKLREGRGPTAATEVAISANLAKSAGYGLGDEMGVLTKQPGTMTFTIVGITGYEGGRDSLAGEMTIFFTEAVAQQVMLGETGVYSAIDVNVADGASLTEVRDRIQNALGEGYSVQTGEELAAQSAEGIKVLFTFFSYLLIGFAGIALFVGVFLILNTFSIVVAQRTRELALFRAMGSSRRQVVGSVLVEAIVVGLIASVIGLAVGIAVGALLAAVLGGALSGGVLELAPFAVPATAIVASFAVGVGVTVVAALLPAVRASRIPPVAAMRDSTIPDRPLTATTIVGAAVLAVGAASLGLGLAGRLGEGNLWGVLGGMLTAFVGIALLTPVISRPVVSLLGRLFGPGAAGKLGRRNSARNPRRTAITAAALMVGIAIVTGVSVIMGSLQRSTEAAVDQGVNADFVVAADPLAGALATLNPATLERIRALPDVESAVGLSADLVKVDGSTTGVTGVDDPAAASSIFTMKVMAGELALGPGQVIVDDTSATARGLSVGSMVSVQTATAGSHTYTIAGTYERTALVSGFVFGAEDTKATFTEAAPIQSFVRLTPGADEAAARAEIDDLLGDDPEIALSTIDEVVAQQAQIFSIVIIFVQLLLGLAMLIAVLGIINTLALSMIERTRELGLLRSIGMKRGQVMWMVSVESTVISVFGALLGVVVGAVLGAAVFQALRSEGFSELAFPWPLMGAYVAASVVVGLLAGLIPAVRAARLDVLGAIAYE